MATTSPSFLRLPADASAQPVPVPRADSVLDLIGNTPLLEITRITAGLLRPGGPIFAKLKCFNPGGSVMDRAPHKMIRTVLASRALRPGKAILDMTSSYHGIPLYLLATRLGH